MKHKLLGLVFLGAALIGTAVGCGEKNQEAQLEDLLNGFSDDGSFGTYDDGGYAADYGDNHSFETEN